MAAPSKIKYITDSIRLPFEPTMVDIIQAYGTFVTRYGVLSTDDREKFDSAICVEEKNDDHYSGCPSCGDGSSPYLSLTFSMPVENLSYEQEMEDWKRENAAQFSREEELRKRVELDRVAHQAKRSWKEFHRQSRLASKGLGRHVTDAHV